MFALLIGCASVPDESSAASVTLPSPPPNASEAPELNRYVALALNDNPALKATRLDWNAAWERTEQAGTLPDPKLTFGNFVESIQTRTGPQRRKYGISQTIPWFGKRGLSRLKAETEAETAWEQIHFSRRELIYRLRFLWHEWLYFRRATAVVREDLKLKEKTVTVAQEGVRAGKSAVDVLSAQMELVRLSEKLTNLQEQESVIQAEFNAVLDRPPTAEITEPAPVADQELDERSSFEGSDALLENHPLLKAWQSRESAAEVTVELARKAFYPDLVFGVDYFDTGPARTPGIPDSGIDPVLITAGVELPIWQIRKRRAELREAEALRDSARLSRQAVKNRLVTELTQTRQKLREAERLIVLYRDRLEPLAQNALKITEQNYRNGQSEFEPLVQAQRHLLEIRLSTLRAIADRAQSLAELEMLTGKPYPAKTP